MYYIEDKKHCDWKNGTSNVKKNNNNNTNEKWCNVFVTIKKTSGLQFL